MVISGVRCFGLSVLSRSRVERLGRDGYGCSYLYRQIWAKDQEFLEKIPEMELGLWVHSSTGDYEMDVIRCTWRIRGGREQRAGGVPIMGDMTKVEVAELYRSGGRGAHEARELKLTPGFVATAEGSVLIEVGHTRVLCNATVENGVPGWMRNSGRGWVTAEYGMLPRATLTRSPREAEKGKIGGRTHEIQRLIGRSLRSVVDMKLLGERTVILDCDVLQADGGTRTAAITGACTALALALGKLVEAGSLKESPLRAMVAATSVGVVDGRVLLDLAYEEDSRAEVDMNVVMTCGGGLVETQATAEKGTYTRKQLDEMLDVAEAGIRELLAAQKSCLEG